MKTRKGHPAFKPGWAEWPGEHCLFIDLDGATLTPSDLNLADGKVVKVGMRLQRLGGKKTASGFTNVHMLPGHFLEYAGSIEDAGKRLAVFSTGHIIKHHVGFYAQGYELFHYTASSAARRVNTDACEWYVAPLCGSCRHLAGSPIDSGLDYCNALKTWRRPAEEVPCDGYMPAVGGAL